ncbi:hypothetical protein M407DRAFT_23623 [Tulasnella calospora MUT 4182]|uniref:Uncharacterized protein n=1 Tax=Tulasnella calospora MUT 4182 TaxID=1051891 RepID=A0A0C3QJ73_9AGAM|nr:hypothetical protein M407DRAFT_23623 [Tulasnella calospora MUT 4182]
MDSAGQNFPFNGSRGHVTPSYPNEHQDQPQVKKPSPPQTIPRPIIYIPSQIHPAGILPPSALGIHLPIRTAHQTDDLAAVMDYLQPAFQHLLRTNLSYVLRESLDRPLIHPTYAQSVQDLVQMLQTQHQREGHLSALQTGEEIMKRMDANFQGACTQWKGFLLHAASTSPGTGLEGAMGLTSAVKGKRFLDLYLPASGYFRDNVKVMDFMMSPLNSHYVCLKDASRGGYSWMNEDERKYVDQATPIDNASRKSATAKKGNKGEHVNQSERLRRIDEVLCKWGYEPERGGGTKERAEAILCAQAATTTEVAIPVIAAAMRRWRLELLEPLLVEMPTLGNIDHNMSGGPTPPERGVFWDVLEYVRTVQNLRQKQVLAAELVLSFNNAGISPFHKIVQELEALLD